MPTPRRPGDPHGRGPGLIAPLVALLLSTTGAQVAAANPTTGTPANFSVQDVAPATSDSGATSTAPASPVTPTPAPPTTPAGPTSPPNPATTIPPPRSGATPAAEIRTPASKPPRVDGPYIGGTIAAGGSFIRLNNFETPDPMSGATAGLRFGQAIYPWMTIGLAITGSYAKRFAEPSQRLLQGAVLVDFGFLPVPRIPLSLHVGFGAGGGAAREAGRPARSGFGGAVFTGAVRYEIFPLAARKRPRRGGGFSLGPELGWLGFTPAAKGRPMSNTVYIGLFLGFYFGS